MSTIKYISRSSTNFCFICGSRLESDNDMKSVLYCSYDKSHFKRTCHINIPNICSTYYNVGRYLIVNSYRHNDVVHTRIFEGDNKSGREEIYFQNDIIEIYPETTEEDIQNILLIK